MVKKVSRFTGDEQEINVDNKTKKPLSRAVSGILCVCRGAPMEIRTPVLTLKGLCPGPLDDGG